MSGSITPSRSLNSGAGASVPKTLRMELCLPSLDQAHNSHLTQVGYVIKGEIAGGEVLSGPYELSSTFFDGRTISTSYLIDIRCTSVLVAAFFQRESEGEYSESGSVSFSNDETLRTVNLDFRVPLSDYVILPARAVEEV